MRISKAFNLLDREKYISREDYEGIMNYTANQLDRMLVLYEYQIFKSSITRTRIHKAVNYRVIDIHMMTGYDTEDITRRLFRLVIHLINHREKELMKLKRLVAS